MPLGERIGDAYVKIHAAGRGIRDDIKRDFKGLDDELGKFGKKHADVYNKSFRDEMNRLREFDNLHLIAGFDESIGQLGARIRRLGPGLQNDIRNRFREIFNDPQLAEIAAQNLFKDIISGAKDIGTGDLFSDITAQMERARAEHKRILALEEADQRAFDRKVSEDRDKTFDLQHRRLAKEAHDWDVMFTEATRLNAQFDRKRSASAKAEASRQAQARKDFDAVRDSILKYSKGTVEASATQATLHKEMDRVQQAMIRTKTRTRETDREFRGLTKTLRRAVPGVDHLGTRLHALSDRMGKAFGKGARNNFVNFVGIVVGGLVRLGTSIAVNAVKLPILAVREIGNFIGSLRALSKVFAEEGIKTGLKATFSALVGVAETALTGGANLLGLAAIMAITATAASLAATAISGLVALLTALAGTVAFALVGAFAPLIGLLAPLIAGFAALAIALIKIKKNLSDFQRAQLQPIIDGFVKLRDTVRQTFIDGIGKNAQVLTKALANLTPLLDAGAKGMVGFVAAFAKSFASPLFARFSDLFSKFIPKALTSLGRSLGNVNTAMVGIFRALVPITRSFLGWLEKITGEFAKWTNSRSGQRQLREFFRKAADSAGVLGDFLKQATKALAKLLDLGRGEGNKIFQQMADAVREFVGWVTSADGKKSIKDWLTWGRELGQLIGNMVIAAAKLVGALDTPRMRSILTFILDSFINILEFLGKYPQAFLFLLGPIGAVAAAVITIVDAVKSLFGFLNQPLGNSWLADLINGATGNLIPGLSKIAGFVGDIKGLFDGGGSSGKAFGDWEAAARSLTGVMSFTDEQTQRLKDSLNQLTGAATLATRAVILQKLGEQHLLTTGTSLGISTRTLIDAALGHRRASRLVSQALFDQWQRTGELTPAQQALKDSLKGVTKEFNADRRAVQHHSAAIREYHGELKSLPRQVRTLIKTSDVTSSVNSIAKVVTAAKKLAPNLSRRDIKTIISSTGAEPTIKKIRAVLARVKEINKARASVPIDATVNPFDTRVKHVKDILNKFRRDKTDVPLGMDDKAFEARAARVRAVLHVLDTTPHAPKVDLNPEQAYQKASALTNYLSNITIPPIFVDIFPRPHGDFSPGSGSPGPSSDPTVPKKPIVPNGRLVSVPSITIVEAADGRATAQEVLNRLAGLSY